jgi:hypothetical protein
MSGDLELIAMGKVLDAIEKLGPEEKQRVLNWAAQKFSLELGTIERANTQHGRKPEQVSDLSTDTLATILGANSGSELVVAAAAHLHFTAGKQKFTRQELTAAMRTAPAHFKETFVNNLSKYLTSLTKSDRLRLVATDTYALSSKQRQQLADKITEAQ